MTQSILSKDIQSLVPVDKITDNYTVKRKILWGPDGTGYDVTTDTPLPVQGTFSPGPPSGWSNFGQATPTQVSVGLSSTPLLLANSNRVFVRINNNSAQPIYIQYSIDAVWGQGQPIRGNSSYVINTTELYTGQINAITQGGSVLIDVTEGVP